MPLNNEANATSHAQSCDLAADAESFLDSSDSPPTTRAPSAAPSPPTAQAFVVRTAGHVVELHGGSVVAVTDADFHRAVARANGDFSERAAEAAPPSELGPSELWQLTLRELAQACLSQDSVDGVRAQSQWADILDELSEQAS